MLYLCTVIQKTTKSNHLKILSIMSIKVKAIERNVSFDKTKTKYAYVLQAELYGKLTEAKVIQEAALRSGISKGAINAAWDALSEVIKAWATEGHSVAVPGLGTMRFGVRGNSVEKVDLVSTSLITARRVIFTPSVEIKQELANTPINITCYDRNGKVVKQVTSDDKGNVDGDGDDGGNDGGNGGSTPGGGNTEGSGDAGGSTKDDGTVE